MCDNFGGHGEFHVIYIYIAITSHLPELSINLVRDVLREQQLGEGRK